MDTDLEHWPCLPWGVLLIYSPNLIIKYYLSQGFPFYSHFLTFHSQNSYNRIVLFWNKIFFQALKLFIFGEIQKNWVPVSIYFLDYLFKPFRLQCPKGRILIRSGLFGPGPGRKFYNIIRSYPYDQTEWHGADPQCKRRSSNYYNQICDVKTSYQKMLDSPTLAK